MSFNTAFILRVRIMGRIRICDNLRNLRERKKYLIKGTKMQCPQSNDDDLHLLDVSGIKSLRALRLKDFVTKKNIRFTHNNPIFR